MSLSNSPFTNRLNTNYVPSPSEILQIRSLLVDPIEEIARIDARIEEMELALTQLQAKRALLQEPVDAHKVLISPMRLIPQDILLEIFFACLPSEHNALIDPTEAPLLFGRVSRYWRSVAYATPMLWSSIHIPPLDYPNIPSNILSRPERIVQSWLERSATCPLTVSLYDFDNQAQTRPDLEKHPIAPHILAVSRRLRCLSLAGDAELLGPILQLDPENLPLLKTLQLIILSNQGPSSTNILGLPSLENVALCITVSTDPLSLPLQWSKLRELRLECHIHWTEQGPEWGLDFEGALNVLRRCLNLEWCELRVTKKSQHSDSAHTPPSIILPRLHTLILGGSEFSLQKWILDLVAPNLHSLRIGRLDSPLNRGTRGRLSVDIDLTRFTSTTSLRESLQSFPKICRLRLVAGSYDRVFLDDEFMALFYSSHHLCPMLTDIEIVVPPSAKVSDAAVLAFIKARMTMSTPLQRFQASFNRPMEFDVMPELQSFIADGLEVIIQYQLS
ncbi:hypothetical protein C8R45DRAFT_447431 [Mycena sanguinolenta]|nr:hypothetical protein C8R45DRAFT_447431 [Mycena sanguinolenta]